VFKDDNVTFVGGYVSVSASIILDFGNKADDGLFYKLVSEKRHEMVLISGASGFQVSSARFSILYTGGCTSVSGSLNLIERNSQEFSTTLTVSHLKKRGTGNCHWVWSLLSTIAALATLIIVPLIEKYAWKLYD
jgi:hypothetical protein